MSGIAPDLVDSVLKRFEREAKALARLAHPNIVQVHDYGEYQGSPFLVMEYLRGGTLKKLAGKPMLYRDAARLLFPVADALAYAHELNIIHRDVKSANILLTEKDQPKLTDFGIAKILEVEGGTQLTGTGVGIGTPEYMAPEQWGGRVIPQTDVYALGVVFYELVTGTRPYSADTPAAILLKQVTDPLPRPKQFIPDLPDQVEWVLYKALAKKPEERYPTMGSFADALENLAMRAPLPVSDTQQTRTAIAEPGVKTKPRRGFPLGWVIGAALALGAVLVAAVLIGVLLMKGVFKTSEGETSDEAAVIPQEIATLPVFAASNTPVVLIEEETVEPEYTLTNLPTPSPTPTLIPTDTVSPDYTPTFAPGAQKISDVDQMVLVYIPGGQFLMGANSSDADEAPEHTVSLTPYWIDRTEVTNAMYFACASSRGCPAPAMYGGYGSVGYENYPVTGVSWQAAYRYCEWAGRRLPTEAEWEMAARGADGRTYPWGFNSPSAILVNFADQSSELDWADGSVNDGYKKTSPVGSYPAGASPFGVLDMAGNVWEWTADWYDEDYYSYSPSEDPQGADPAYYHTIRGGSWDSLEKDIRTTSRFGASPEVTWQHLGFRCALSAGE